MGEETGGMAQGVSIIREDISLSQFHIQGRCMSISSIICKNPNIGLSLAKAIYW